MKSPLSALIACVALTLLTVGIDFAQDAPKPLAAAGCALQFETVHHDLGEVPDTSPVQYTFKFKNVSDRRVTLSRNTGHCDGCTPPRFNKRAYEAGESGEVLVTLNPKNRKGLHTRHVIVETDDPTCPRVEVTLCMTVMPLVYIDPSKIFFNESMRGKGSTKTITVTGREPNFEITRIEGDSPVFTATKTRTDPVIEDGRLLTCVTVEVTLSKDAPLGTHNFTFILHTTDPTLPRVDMQVAGTVVGDVRATPPGMLVRKFTATTPFTAQVQLDSRAGRAFRVKSVDVEGPAEMSLAVDVEPSNQDGNPIFLVTLAGMTPADPGQYRGVVTVDTDIPGEAPFTFNWIATVKAPSAGAR